MKRVFAALLTTIAFTGIATSQTENEALRAKAHSFSAESSVLSAVALAKEEAKATFIPQTQSPGSSEKEDKQVALAVSSILDANCTAVREDNIVAALRNQLVSELVQEYNCCVLGRSTLYDVAREDAIQKITTTGSAKIGASELLAADYLIAARFTKDGSSSIINGQLWHEDTRGDAGKISSNEQFSATNLSVTPKAISDKLAKLLGLQRIIPSNRIPVDTKLVWAVLPFVRFDKMPAPRVYSETQRQEKDTTDDKLSIRVEVTLQQNRAVGPLVDRSKINAVLSERKLVSMVDANMKTLAETVNITGADRMLMGFVLDLLWSCLPANKTEKKILFLKKNVVIFPVYVQRSHVVIYGTCVLLSALLARKNTRKWISTRSTMT